MWVCYSWVKYGYLSIKKSIVLSSETKRKKARRIANPIIGYAAADGCLKDRFLF